MPFLDRRRRATGEGRRWGKERYLRPTYVPTFTGAVQGSAQVGSHSP